MEGRNFAESNAPYLAITSFETPLYETFPSCARSDYSVVDLENCAGDNTSDGSSTTNTSSSECSNSRGWSVFVQNAVLGASDGSTVPFALAAGLSGSVQSSAIVIVAVVAELAAGCISMGLGGYMAAQAEADFYKSEKEAIIEKLTSNPDAVLGRLSDILGPIGIPQDILKEVAKKLESNPNACAEFLIRHELGTEEPDRTQPFKSAAVVGLSYVVAGSIPLVPFFMVDKAKDALKYSIFVGLFALFLFGWIKGRLLGVDRKWSAIQTTLLGAAAALSAYWLAGIFQ